MQHAAGTLEGADDPQIIIIITITLRSRRVKTVGQRLKPANLQSVLYTVHMVL